MRFVVVASTALLLSSVACQAMVSVGRHGSESISRGRGTLPDSGLVPSDDDSDSDSNDSSQSEQEEAPASSARLAGSPQWTSSSSAFDPASDADSGGKEHGHHGSPSGATPHATPRAPLAPQYLQTPSSAPRAPPPTPKAPYESFLPAVPDLLGPAQPGHYAEAFGPVETSSVLDWGGHKDKLMRSGIVTPMVQTGKSTHRGFDQHTETHELVYVKCFVSADRNRCAAIGPKDLVSEKGLSQPGLLRSAGGRGGRAFNEMILPSGYFENKPESNAIRECCTPAVIQASPEISECGTYCEAAMSNLLESRGANPNTYSVLPRKFWDPAKERQIWMSTVQRETLRLRRYVKAVVEARTENIKVIAHNIGVVRAHRLAEGFKAFRQAYEARELRLGLTKWRVYRKARLERVRLRELVMAEACERKSQNLIAKWRLLQAAFVQHGIQLSSADDEEIPSSVHQGSARGRRANHWISRPSFMRGISRSRRRHNHDDDDEQRQVSDERFVGFASFFFHTDRVAIREQGLSEEARRDKARLLRGRHGEIRLGDSADDVLVIMRYAMRDLGEIQRSTYLMLKAYDKIVGRRQGGNTIPSSITSWRLSMIYSQIISATPFRADRGEIESILKSKNGEGKLAALIQAPLDETRCLALRMNQVSKVTRLHAREHLRKKRKWREVAKFSENRERARLSRALSALRPMNKEKARELLRIRDKTATADDIKASFREHELVRKYLSQLKHDNTDVMAVAAVGQGHHHDPLLKLPVHDGAALLTTEEEKQLDQLVQARKVLLRSARRSIYELYLDGELRFNRPAIADDGRATIDDDDADASSISMFDIDDVHDVVAQVAEEAADSNDQDGDEEGLSSSSRSPATEAVDTSSETADGREAADELALAAGGPVERQARVVEQVLTVQCQSSGPASGSVGRRELNLNGEDGNAAAVTSIQAAGARVGATLEWLPWPDLMTTDGAWRVVGVVAGGASELAGIRANDILTKIHGHGLPMGTAIDVAGAWLFDVLCVAPVLLPGTSGSRRSGVSTMTRLVEDDT